VTTTNAPLAPPAVAGWLGDRNGMLPLAAVEIDAVVCGLVATTTVRQTFRNTRTTGIEASYVFPLPDRAGVTAFVADLAGRRVEGELRERGEARAEYDAAIAAGHRAAITEEERSGVFSTRVGNLQPGEDAVITLTLTGRWPSTTGRLSTAFRSSSRRDTSPASLCRAAGRLRHRRRHRCRSRCKPRHPAGAAAGPREPGPARAASSPDRPGTRAGRHPVQPARGRRDGGRRRRGRGGPAARRAAGP